jgi:hypothetical protein
MVGLVVGFLPVSTSARIPAATTWAVPSLPVSSAMPLDCATVDTLLSK